MDQKTDIHPIDVRENISLPSERLVSRFPAIANIAALDAALATTKLAIESEHPSMQELMYMIEDGEKVPPHLFLAHCIIDNLDRLRLAIHSYSQQINTHINNIRNDDLPF